MATPIRQPNRQSGRLAAATAAIVDWARHWWSGSDNRPFDRDSHTSRARAKDLYNQPVDRRGLWRDGAIVVGGLAIAMLLVGGGIWAVLHHLEQTQNTGPAKTKRVEKSTAHEADRGLQLSAVGLPATPQVGQALVIPLRALDTSGVAETVLYDGSDVVSRQPGMATSVTWTPRTAGTHELKVAVQLDNDGQAVSAALPINVSSGNRSSSPTVSGNITATAQALVDAINTKNWDALRQIDPTKSDWTDRKLNADYRTLERDTLVPVSSTPRSHGVARLKAGLLANEQSRTELFCVTWDVDPAAHTAIQVQGRSVAQPLPAGIPAKPDVRLRLAAICAAS